MELRDKIARTLLLDVMDGCKSTPVGLADQILKEVGEEIEKVEPSYLYEYPYDEEDYASAGWRDCRQKILSLFTP